MMKAPCAILLVLIFHVSFGQKQIIRNQLIFGTQSLITSSVWADDAGYQVLDFQFQGHEHIFMLVHEQHGELGKMNRKVSFNQEDMYGLTSNEKELTLYFRGYLNGRKDNYFMTFFKDGKRQPIITTWMNEEVEGDIIASYGFDNKLYLLKELKKEFRLIEVEDYSKFQTISFPKTELKMVSGDPTWDAKVNNTTGKIASCKFSMVKLYPTKDSLFIVADRNSLDATFLISLNFKSAKVTSRTWPVDKSLSSFNSMVLGNRLYRMATNKKMVILSVYAYPSFQLLNEFKYTVDQKVDIKISELTDERGKVIEKDRHPDVEDEKVVAKIIRSGGAPYFSVLQDSVTILDITFQITSSGSMHSMPGQPGMSYSTGPHTNEVTFSACFTDKFEPCGDAISKDNSRKIILMEELKRTSDSPLSSFTENRTSVFGLHYEDREYYIEKFEKNN